MEKLTELLKIQIKELDKKCNGKYDLSDKVILDLFSVYPFNKFEYIISHLIAEKILTVDTHGHSPWHFTVQASLDLNPVPLATLHTQ